MSTLIDISIGPVQQFVGQSRRTRDLWASSYLLSFLAAHAMRGAEEAGADLHVDRDDPMLQAARGGSGREPPRTASVPNRFRATVSSGDAHTVAEAARQHMFRAWHQVCDAVRNRYVTHAEALGNGTGDIWRRQVENFWQFMWVAGPDDAPLLARRKCWRSHYRPDEPGDSCTVMPAFQELSGHVQAGRGGEDQRGFWERVRAGARTGRLDLREDERLCAVALVKRLYAAGPEVARQALGWDPDVSHWPSTVWIGAVPWLRDMGAAAAEAAGGYADAVAGATGRGTRRPLPPPLARLVTAGDPGGVPHYASLDANYWHAGYVSDPQRFTIDGGQNRDAERVRADLLGRLRPLYDSQRHTGARLGAPPSYYAIVLADGDKLGDLTSRIGREQVSHALSDFARGWAGAGGAGAIVEQHHGVTVYAGGDDLLAMLPAPDALPCADALARHYRHALGRHGAPDAHLSAEVLFCHIRMPLATVLAEAHRLLEDVAKASQRRDSVAVAVWKPGGPHSEWVSHWARHTEEGEARAVAALGRLAEDLRPDPSGAAAGFSSSVLYRSRETLSRLCGEPRWTPGLSRPLAVGVDLAAYLRAEILQCLSHEPVRAAGRSTDEVDANAEDGDEARRARADALASRMSALLRDDAPAGSGEERVSLDALLLARFLAHDGREEERT